MHGPETKAPALAIWALGLTQIIGYGTLYYSFSILAPAMAAEFALPEQWIFAALSAALLLGSLLAPTAGRVMTFGSLAAAAALACCAAAPGRLAFVASLLAMEAASCFVLYSAAFVALVQAGPIGASRSITHLTLIAGFASTLFWPLTSTLHAGLTWREVYLVFAALNLFVCLPIHFALMRHAHRRSVANLLLTPSDAVLQDQPIHDAHRARLVFLLMLAGFAIEGFVLSAVLLHMVPLVTALGLGSAGVLVSTLFGPSQVASRLVNMMFGGRLPQTHLAVIAAALLAIGLAIALIAAPRIGGVAAFVILFGLGSGLISIVSGTLPLELFGRAGYGARLGWIGAARQFSSAFAPFALAFAMAQTSAAASIWMLFSVAAAGLIAFAAIAAAAWRP